MTLICPEIWRSLSPSSREQVSKRVLLYESMSSLSNVCDRSAQRFAANNRKALNRWLYAKFELRQFDGLLGASKYCYVSRRPREDAFHSESNS
jgi:hypothetical protein